MECLTDEILLMIFKHLYTDEITVVSQVNKRLRNVARDASLYKTLSFQNKLLVSSKYIHTLMHRYKEQMLSLSLMECFWIPSNSLKLALESCCNLRELYLTGSNLQFSALEIIINNNPYLTKLAWNVPDKYSLVPLRHTKTGQFTQTYHQTQKIFKRLTSIMLRFSSLPSFEHFLPIFDTNEIFVNELGLEYFSDHSSCFNTIGNSYSLYIKSKEKFLVRLRDTVIVNRYLHFNLIVMDFIIQTVREAADTGSLTALIAPGTSNSFCWNYIKSVFKTVSFKKIDLSYCILGKDQMAWLSNLKQLKHLNLSSVSLFKLNLMKVVALNNPMLVSLNLSSCHDWIEKDLHGLEALALHCVHLKELNKTLDFIVFTRSYKMKFYLHFNLKKDGFISAVVEVNDNSCPDIKTCMQLICIQLQKERNLHIEASSLDIYFKKKLLSSDMSLSVLSCGNDLHVEINNDKVLKDKIVYDKSIVSKSTNGIEVKLTEKLENDLKCSEIKTLQLKAKKFVEKKRYDLAVALYKEMIEIDKNSVEGMLGVAYIYLKACRYADAIPFFLKIVNQDPTNFTVLVDYSESLIKIGDCQKAINFLSRGINDMKRSKDFQKIIHNANVALACALEVKGELQHAFQLFLTVAQMTEKQHIDGLIGYARVGFKLNQVSLEDVFLVLLNAIVRKKDDNGIKKLFAEMIQENGGYSALVSQMQDAKSDPTAVVYIASIVREFGALNYCKDLLEHAYSLAPSSIDIALLLTHVYENLCSFNDGLNFAMKFLNEKHDRQVLRRVDLSSISHVIKLLELQNYDDLKDFVLSKLSQINNDKQLLLKGNMADIELQLLALYFTVVKICFVMGILDCVLLFVKLLDPLFNANENLHKTLIKNEQAYYSCISKIYNTCPPPFIRLSPLETSAIDQKLIFAIGESHVLPLAWRNLKYNDLDYVIHPILVTGIKIWHLRKDSMFYTRSNFDNAIKMIPDGSSCFFLLGEIDCREGIQSAMEKCCYDSVEQCVTFLAGIYLEKLLHLAKSKKLKIFVHPIVPTLKETFFNVRLLNECLKRELKKHPRLIWLDFVDKLITENDLLKEEYHFDGIHLHPNYIGLIEKCLLSS